MKGFSLTSQGKVQESWIDRNGHMNIMWYMALFDKGTDVMLEKIGITSTSMGSDATTTIASRIYVAHRKELLVGEAWELWSGLTSLDAASLTFTHRLVSLATMRATCDIKTNAFSIRTRKQASLPVAILERAKKYLVPGLADYFQR